MFSKDGSLFQGTQSFCGRTRGSSEGSGGDSKGSGGDSEGSGGWFGARMGRFGGLFSSFSWFLREMKGREDVCLVVFGEETVEKCFT